MAIKQKFTSIRAKLIEKYQFDIASPDVILLLVGGTICLSPIFFFTMAIITWNQPNANGLFFTVLGLFFLAADIDALTHVNR